MKRASSSLSLRAALAALAAAASLALAGCGEKEAEIVTPEGTPATTATTATTAPGAAAVQVAYPQGSVKVGDRAVCVVCNKKEGTTNKEEVKAVLDYQGKTYAFCNDGEKAEFISAPATYAQAK